MFNQNSFSCDLFDPDAQPVKGPGTWGCLGFGATYRGEISNDDRLVTAIRQAMDDAELASEQVELVRSFCISWLMGLRKDLGNVIAFAVPLPPAVDQVCRIGMLGRTTRNVAAGAAAIGATLLLLDATWDLVQGEFQQMSGPELAASLATDIALDAVTEIIIPDSILGKIDAGYGLPGEALAASSFTAEPLYSFLRLGAIRGVIQSCHVIPAVRHQLIGQIDRRIFALFLVNSRQTEGLVRSGASENSAAVVAHTAMALGLHNNPDTDEMLGRIESAIENLADSQRATEANTTLAAIRQNLNCDFANIERRLHRHSMSATTTEAVDMVAYPISATFDLFSTIAGGLGKLASNTKAESLFSLTQEGFKAASTAVDATPDAISHAIKGGVTAEEWARTMVSKVWPFGKQPESHNSDRELPAVDEHTDSTS